MRSVIRKPSPRKYVSSRTKSSVTRTVRHTIDPTYGRKGTGIIKDPKKAAYNKIYSQTSIGINDTFHNDKGSYSHSMSSDYDSNTQVGFWSSSILDIVWGFLLAILGLISLVNSHLILGIGCFIITGLLFRRTRKAADSFDTNNDKKPYWDNKS